MNPKSQEQEIVIPPSIGCNSAPMSASASVRHEECPNIRSFILRDDPKPAIFIARTIFIDFIELVRKKIESTLDQKTRDRPIFKCLSQDDDVHYQQVLGALRSISEFCLPSTLEILIAWYHHQIGCASDGDQPQRRSLLSQTSEIGSQLPSQQHNPTCDHQIQQQLSLECGSPTVNDSFLASNSSMLRSPTPSSPDTSNQLASITLNNLLPDHQTSSLTVISTSDQQHSSAANTSTSTATNVSSNSLLNEDSVQSSKRSDLIKTRNLLIEYAFCQCLIEIFNQLHLHPGYEDLVCQIENIAFEHFIYSETNHINANELSNINLLADKYAEVIGVLARTRFALVRKRFMSDLNELRAKDPTPLNIQCIVTLLSSMRHFRVRMAPIEDFEASFQFLQELADYFVEVRHKSIKHALAELFVEIMVPLASSVKNEVKIPCLKNFVDTLWTPALDMCTRKKHSTTFYPLVTCLLCASQRSFFLANWVPFLTMCLSSLKNRDQKMCRIALESLYRLIWIYMIRVKCESNNVTQIRLQSIVDALFPRGSRSIVPRDAPLNLFVDIIQFIAQERLDFAMRHIIFDLMSVDRPPKVILTPERMNIALQAFLVIADGLQLKDGEPTMPGTVNITSSIDSRGSSQVSSGKQLPATSFLTETCVRRAHVSKMLNDETARSIGLSPYYAHIQKSFNDILKALDAQYGKPMLLISNSGKSKETDDVTSGERKPKIELFKTCIAAIPRLIPDGMSKMDLIDLLSRMTVHRDEEMRKLAFESLQILVSDLAEWRLETIEGFTTFIANQIDETQRQFIDNALRMLLQLLVSWRNVTSSSSSGGVSSLESNGKTPCTVNIQTGYETVSSRSNGTSGGQIAARKNRALIEMRLIQSELSNTRFDKLVSVIQRVEGASLVMLCSRHQKTRKLATHLLRECRALLKCYSSWNCMEQFGFRTPDDVDQEEDLSASLKGSISADNLSRITAISAYGPAHSSITSINTQAAAISTSISKVCISSHLQQQQQQEKQHHHHDPYDSDIENNIADCFAMDDNSSLVFWISIIMLESERQQEYMLALRLLRKVLPDLPFEQPDFQEEVEKELKKLKWENFRGIHPLILKGCTSSLTYDLVIVLLDLLTPILSHPICNSSKSEQSFPLHVVVLLTHLLANYEDPTSSSLNIARRLAIWCDENSQKLENLSTVMTLYSRRSFSKDAFQWTKCVIKYLFDAYPETLPSVIPLLVEMLENGSASVQGLIAPIIYCILNYVDVGSSSLNGQLARIYSNYLGKSQWKDATQIFKLIISRSSYLADSCPQRRELPGRTIDFSLDVKLIPIISKARLVEYNSPILVALTPSGESSNQDSQMPSNFQDHDQLMVMTEQVLSDTEKTTLSPALTSTHSATPTGIDGTLSIVTSIPEDGNNQQTPAHDDQVWGSSAATSGRPAEVTPATANATDSTVSETMRWRRSWLANSHVRERLFSLLMS